MRVKPSPLSSNDILVGAAVVSDRKKRVTLLGWRDESSQDKQDWLNPGGFSAWELAPP